MELPIPWGELKVILPITIGSVPLRSDFQHLLPQSVTATEKQRRLPRISYADFRECLHRIRYYSLMLRGLLSIILK